MRVRDAADKPWRDLVVMPFESALFGGEVFVGSLIAGFHPDGKTLIIHSALHSDKGRLVRVDFQKGRNWRSGARFKIRRGRSGRNGRAKNADES